MRIGRQLFAIVVMLLFASCVLFAQSASTSTLIGDVTDTSGAVVAGAEVGLTDLSTNLSQTSTTNQVGHYAFQSVQPGQYRLTVKKDRFRQTTTNLTISVGVNVTQNFKLEVGGANEVVEVQASGQDLQTTDASVGNVLDRATLQSLPSLSRDATALLQLQPMAAPSYNAGPGTSGGEGNTTSGGVAGALNDQNTFNLDGGDATSNTEGDANYNTGEGTPSAVVPTPVESIEEFRVTTNNSNTFARSSGAQVQLVTRHGTNLWHGAVYEFNQNTDYNANFWQLNHENTPRPVWQDNRFGGRIGGPILKDKAFFFLMYEGRRFRKGQTFTRYVPTAALKQGILQFHDATTGAVDQFNFNPANGPLSTACPVSVSNPTGACDPRGLGINPDISQIWNTYEPAGNNPSEGDGLNFIGFDGNVPIISHENDGIARLDYNINKNWTAYGVGRYAVVDINGAAQIDIGGITGGQLGVPKSTDLEPLQPRYYVLGLTGHLGSNITTDTHFNYLRHFWQWHRTQPFAQEPSLGAAVQIYAESNVSGLVPMNIDTQNARSRIWDGKDYNLNEELSWLKGSHVIQFGGSFRHQHFYHVRDDKVVGGLSVPIYFAEWTSANMDISAYRPSSLTTSDQHNWDKLYAATMGLIDHSAQLLTRAPDLTPNPPGTPNTQTSLVNDYDIHVVDTWRMRPNLTVAYGLDYGYATPPYETTGQQTVMVDAATNQPLPFNTWANNMVSHALQGQVYNPTLGFMPVRKLGWHYPYHPDYHNFAPRLSIAWNPKGGPNVFRLGYGRYFDRINGVGIVMTPALGIGFGNGVSCKAPDMSNVCGGSGPKSTPATALRIGTDSNTVTIPQLQNVTAPIIPGTVANANTPYQTYDFRIDPNRKNGVEDTWTFNFQRRMSNSTLLEVGYVGRVGKHLYSGADVNQIPYMFTLGGQQFAQAYDALQQPGQLSIIGSGCTGPTPATCPVTPQPFFESALGPGGTANVAYNAGSFILNGDATDTFDYLGINPLPLDQQFLGADITTSNGSSFYNAGYVSVRKQMSQGLMLQGNYTWSHSMDDAGLAQEYIFFNPTDGFNLNRDYTNSYFDRRHVFTGFFVYDLPFGGTNRFRTGNFVDKIIGGWQLSSDFTASSGLPYKMYNYNSCAELGDGYLTQCASWIPTGPGAYAHFARHNLPDGSVQVFSNPTAVGSSYRAPLFSDSRMGGTPLVGFPRWNFDSALTKTTQITERVSFGLSLQAVNLFNHMEFADPGVDLSSASTSTYGQTSTQYNTPRFLNLGLRVDF